MYIRIWRYRPRLEKLPDFLSAYGPDGAWARLFGKAEGYLGTELVHVVTEPATYLVIDQWDDDKAWQAFISVNKQAYAELDTKCDAYLLEEIKIGDFTSAPS